MFISFYVRIFGVFCGKEKDKSDTSTGRVKDVTITILDEEKVVVKKSVAANTHVDIELGNDFKTW